MRDFLVPSSAFTSLSPSDNHHLYWIPGGRSKYTHVPLICKMYQQKLSWPCNLNNDKYESKCCRLCCTYCLLSKVMQLLVEVIAYLTREHCQNISLQVSLLSSIYYNTPLSNYFPARFFIAILFYYVKPLPNYLVPSDHTLIQDR